MSPRLPARTEKRRHRLVGNYGLLARTPPLIDNENSRPCLFEASMLPNPSTKFERQTWKRVESGPR